MRLSADGMALDVMVDRAIAYAVTDAGLRVVELRGAPGIFGAGASGWLGRSLFDLVPELIGELRKRGLGDVTVVVGGVIPEQDYGFLREAGVAEIFGPGTNVLEAGFSVLNQIEGRLSNR